MVTENWGEFNRLAQRVDEEAGEPLVEVMRDQTAVVDVVRLEQLYGVSEVEMRGGVKAPRQRQRRG